MLDAALEVFTQRGYGDTAVDEIARVSDTSKGGLYFHFPSKQALFLALLDEASVALLQRVEDATAAESDPLLRGDAALREVLHALQVTASWRGYSSSKHSEPGKEFNAKLNDLHAAFAALIADCLEDAVTQGQIPPLDTQVAAHAWYGAINHVVLRWLLNGEPSRLEETYPALRALLLYGVTGAGRERGQ